LPLSVWPLSLPAITPVTFFCKKIQQSKNKPSIWARREQQWMGLFRESQRARRENPFSNIADHHRDRI
jgi:hypothetical protein